MPPFRLLVLASAIALPLPARADEFFEKKIRPILVENCHSCHSAKTKQKGGLTLDSRAALLKGGDTGPAVVPGSPEKSLLIELVHYAGDIKMPPRGKLADAQIADLTQWIKSGAPWPTSDEKIVEGPKAFDLKERAKFWSFQRPTAPAVPAVRDAKWPRSPVDAFILAKLDEAGLKPAPDADRRAWLRRVTVDLIGLPPTVEEINAFAADDSDDAFGKVVDRLLKSPHYGERWARHWLDLVRFAETAGHEFDFEMPEAWRYRDYLIRAFNADLPYDQFVVEHLAGDLLPEPRRHPTERFNESVMATGFWFFGESKHSPVDIRGDEADRVDNQIDVFGKTFLGLTVACARCHDHKFDAITTRDYYSIAGFLQSSRYQRAFIDDPAPRQKTLADLDAVRAAASEVAKGEAIEKLRTFLATEDGVQRAADAIRKKYPGDPKAVRERESKAKPFEEFRGESYDGWFPSGEAFGTGPTKAGEMRFGSTTLLAPGVAHSGRTAGKACGVLRSTTFRLDSDLLLFRAAGKQTSINLIIDGFQQIRAPIYGGLTVGVNFNDDEFHRVAIDVRMWKGHNAYIELIDDSAGYIAVDRIVTTNADGSLAPVPDVAKLDRERLMRLVENWQSGKFVRLPEAEDDILFLNAMLPLAGVGDAAWQSRKAEYDELATKVPVSRRAMAMCDGSPENERVHIRGNHKSLGTEVERRNLEAVAGVDPIKGSESGSGRLALARQLVGPDNPFVARVIVNRVWHHHFGRGLVASTDDFGKLGQAPTHPELLDHLAVGFVKGGWSLKKLHRELVLSRTYRMASTLEPASEEKDPRNLLLHRMPVRRMEAEAIRDSLLMISGRLDRRMEGPGPLPHLTEFMVGRGRPGSGPLDGDGRRSVYLNVRRNFLNPMFLAFDFPIPFSTMGRRSVSNVPAQALAMMNNPFVIQQAGLWGKRHAGPGRPPRERIAAMYAEAFARPPSEVEISEALAFVDASGRDYGSPDDPRVWGDLAHVLVNLKEFIFVP